jgi:RimJ/RimL family protein N-acetyltransferase
MLQGRLVRLRAPERTDLSAFVRWFNNPEVTRFLLRSPPMGMAEEVEWYDGLQQRPDRHFCIETLDGRLIGNLGLIRLEWINRSAELGVMIGEKEFWGRGYGTDAILIFLDYLFDELGLNRIFLYCHVDNVRARRCYEKCGFSHEGTFRQHHYKEGEYVDCVAMAILKEDRLNEKGKKGR